MLRWGLALVISATLACIFGVWSILVAPFVGPTGFRVSHSKSTAWLQD